MTMDELTAFRLWYIAKLHFTTEKFDFTKSKGVRGLNNRYNKLTDKQKYIFNRFAKGYKNEKELCRMLIASFLDEMDPRYEPFTLTETLYKNFMFKKESMTYKLQNDFEYVRENVKNPHDLLSALNERKITHETVLIIDAMKPFLDRVHNEIEFLGYKTLILALRKYRAIFDSKKYIELAKEILTNQ